MVVLGCAFAVSYVPGVAPRTAGDAADHMAPVPNACSTAACPSPALASIGVATDGDDLLVLLGRPDAGSSPAGGPRIVLNGQSSEEQIVLQRDGAGPGWRVDAHGRAWTVLATRNGSIDVLRLPGPAPGRWSATVDGVRVPARDSADVVELSRLRDAISERDPMWTAAAVLAAIIVVLRGYRSANRGALRAALTAIAFGLLTLFGLPWLAEQLSLRAPDSPGLLTMAAILWPLLALGVAATAARRVTARISGSEAPRSLRLVTGMSALLLLALVAYAVDLDGARYFPGLS